MAYPWVEKLQLSHSSRCTLSNCDRKFELYKLYQHATENRSLPGDVGTCLHNGYQEYMKSRDEDKAFYEMMLSYPIDLNSDVNYERSLESCFSTLTELIHAKNLQQYELVDIKCLDGEVRPAIEVPFEIFLPGVYLDTENKRIPISYIGYIDIVVWNRIEQEFEVIDIKSHRRTIKELSPLYANSEQCIPYAIILEWLTKQNIKSLKVTYLSAYVDLLMPKVVPYSFNKGERDIRDWANGLMIDIIKLQQFYKMEWFPRSGGNTEQCMSWNKKCPFFDNVCGSRNQNAIQYHLLNGDDKPVKKVHEPWITMELELAA